MATGNAWVEVAPRLDFKNQLYDLAEWNNKVHCSVQDGGRLFEWNGVNAWTQVAAHIGASEALSLALHGGSLYCSTGDVVAPTTHKGRLYRFTGSAWVSVASQYDAPLNGQLLALANLGGNLYSGGHDLLVWNGSNAWTLAASQVSGGPMRHLVVYNSNLYAACADGLYKFTGSAMSLVSGAVNINSLCVFNNTLYAGAEADGNLYEWNGVDTLTSVAAQLNGQTLIGDLVVYDGKLYGGTFGGARLFEWNGVNAWIQVAPNLAATSINALLVYKAKLYGVTNGGKLYEWNGTITSSGQVIVVK